MISTSMSPIFYSFSNLQPCRSFRVSTSIPPAVFLMSCTADTAQPMTTFSTKQGLTFVKSPSFYFKTKYFGTLGTVADDVTNLSVSTEDKCLLLCTLREVFFLDEGFYGTPQLNSYVENFDFCPHGTCLLYTSRCV